MTVNNPPAPGDTVSKDDQTCCKKRQEPTRLQSRTSIGMNDLSMAVLSGEVETHILDDYVSPRIKNRTKGIDQFFVKA